MFILGRIYFSTSQDIDILGSGHSHSLTLIHHHSYPKILFRWFCLKTRFAMTPALVVDGGGALGHKRPAPGSITTS